MKKAIAIQQDGAERNSAANEPESLPVLDPHIRLVGTVDDAMFKVFIEELTQARKNLSPMEPVLLCLTTTGGEAETARRIADELTLVRERENRPLRFVGKTAVYSAGVTIMAAFARGERYLTRGTELLIHERRVTKTVELSGALRGNVSKLRDLLAEMDSGQRLERDGFRQLVQGSSMSVDQLLAKVMEADWYLTADEALAAGLIQSVI